MTDDALEPAPDDELAEVRERYRRRADDKGVSARYSLLHPEVLAATHQRQRAMVAALRRLERDLDTVTLVDVGCGSGGNLLEFLRLGMRPQHLQGLELLEDRYAEARHVLPSALTLRLGDASQAPIAPGSVDVVLQSTVFSSLLDDAFQEHLARRMWSWVAPGGAVLWYDFTVDNPRNPDVRGVPRARVEALFPEARASFAKVTLAPPIGRLLGRKAPVLLPLATAVPPLRTHLVGWLAKPAY